MLYNLLYESDILIYKTAGRRWQADCSIFRTDRDESRLATARAGPPMDVSEKNQRAGGLAVEAFVTSSGSRTIIFFCSEGLSIRALRQSSAHSAILSKGWRIVVSAGDTKLPR